MPNIEVSQAAFEKLAFAARVAGTSIREAVDRLVDAATASTAVLSADARADIGREGAPSSRRFDDLRVFVVYKGARFDGILNLATERLTITDGPSHEVFAEYSSPSQAAMAVVAAVSPERRRKETNGWRFWHSPDGGLIDEHRRRSS